MSVDNSTETDTMTETDATESAEEAHDTDDPTPGIPESDGSAEEFEIRQSTFGDSALPHAHEPNGLKWTIETCRLDTGREVPVERMAGSQRVSLLSLRGWETAILEGSVTLSAAVYDGVVADPDDGDRPDADIVMIVHCREAIHRGSQETASAVAPGTYDFTVKIDRDEVYGTVTLTPSLVLAESAAADDDKATDRGARLADGPSATVAVDLTRQRRNLLHPKRRRFSKNDALPPEDHLIHFEVEGDDAPQLYLNDDHEEVVDVLDTDVHTGYDARIRDLGYDILESQLWPQFVALAAAGVDPTTGETQEDWHADVIRQLRGPVYDEDRSVAEVAMELHDDIQDPESNARLQREVEDFVQSDTEVNAPGDLEALLTLVRNRGDH